MREVNTTKPILPVRTNLRFLVQIKVIVDFEEGLAGAKT